MAIELEAKMRVADLNAVRERLRAIGADPRGRVLEVNTFFETPDRALLRRDSGLRLRHTRDLDTGGEKDVVTFKGPMESGQLKRREEIEFGVTDGNATKAVFDRLGYRPDLTFEKRRETWHLDGCTIELDELPSIGTFIEIEGPDEPTVMRVREKLGLNDVPLVKSGYAHLVSTWLKEHGAREPVLRF